MKILIDINHPAHVHLFRNAAQTWKEHGHQVIITIRDRDIITDLLDAYQLDYIIVSKQRYHFMWMFTELLEHDWNVFKVALKERPDVLIGTSIAIGHVSSLLPGKSVYFDEDDADYHQLGVWLTHPFVDKVVTPEILRDKKTRKYVTYNSLHELAYLHPDHFEPDPGILQELGVSAGEPYFIIRMVAMKAYHDVHHAGLSMDSKRRLIEMLSRHGRVFITNEGEIPEEFRPYQIPISPHRIHHALNYASMLICDGQTMTIEAAVLGVPSIRINTFVGKCSVIEELEHRYGLTYGFLPDQEETMLQKVEELLHRPDLKQEWLSRQKKLLDDKCNLATWMVDYIENTYDIPARH